MKSTIQKIVLLAAALILSAFTTGVPEAGGAAGFAAPVLQNRITHENQYLLAFNLESKLVQHVSVFAPWDSSIVVNLASRNDRAFVLESLEKMVPQHFVWGEIRCITYPYHQTAETTITVSGQISRPLLFDLLRQDTVTGAVRQILNAEVPYGRIRVSGWVPQEIDLAGVREGYCTGNSVATTIHLKPGLNTIYLEYRGSDRYILGADSLGIFYQTGNGPEQPPVDFVSETFHRSSRETACVSCHRDASAGSAALKCSSCHAALAAQSHVHAPVAGGDCSSCHYEEADSGYAVRYKVSEESQTCLGCHDALETELKEKPNVHKPVGKGLCSTCHSPHGSTFTKQLRREINDQCFSCHAEKRDGSHPVVFHPVGDHPDPNQPGKDLTCLSCHAPHASPNIDMLLTSGGYFAVCQTCHQK